MVNQCQEEPGAGAWYRIFKAEALILKVIQQVLADEVPEITRKMSTPGTRPASNGSPKWKKRTSSTASARARSARDGRIFFDLGKIQHFEQIIQEDIPNLLNPVDSYQPILSFFPIFVNGIQKHLWHKTVHTQRHP